MNTIHDRIRQARTDKNLSMEGMAKLLGVRAWQTIQQWENGSTAPKRNRLDDVARVLGVTVEYLMQGTGSDENSEHVPVTLVDARASAGHGSLVFSEDVDRVLMFRRDWLARHDAKPDDVLAFPVKGSSMVDMHIVDGSVVLVNQGKKEPTSKKVYVLWIDGRLYVKQLVKHNGQWLARSHNSAEAAKFPDIPIEIDARIVGRAFWCGFSL